jgi:pheromone shutdown protein TraB
MKKRFAGLVLVGAAVATVLMKRKKQDEEPVLITLDDDEQESEFNSMDQDYPHIKVSERQSWQTRIKILLKALVEEKQLTLIHHLKFKSQNDLFEAIKQAKQLDYTLAEADEKHQVVLEKIVENFYDDICKAVLEMAEITRSHTGEYREFEIKK